MNCFACTTEEEENKIMQERNSINAVRATESTLRILTQYLNEKQLPELEEISDDELPNILKSFYTNLRTMNSELYALQSLKCIRAGINHHTKVVRNLDIISDIHFAQ